MAARKVKVLLLVGGFDVYGGAEVRLVNKYVNIQEGDMGRAHDPSKLDSVASIEELKENGKEIMTMSPQQEQYMLYFDFDNYIFSFIFLYIY
jgi:hypothetical protein